MNEFEDGQRVDVVNASAGIDMDSDIEGRDVGEGYDERMSVFQDLKGTIISSCDGFCEIDFDNGMNETLHEFCLESI